MVTKIGVGIVGANPDRGWGSTAHIPAIRSLPGFELVALSTTSANSSRAAAEKFGVERAFSSPDELIACPAVDLVTIAVKVPRHFELVSAAISAGKAVYCEWPLGNGLDEAIRMAEMARTRNVRTIVGLQARAEPVVNYIRDLVRDGYIGQLLSSTLVGSGVSWGPVVDKANAYLYDVRNGSTLLTITAGHSIDALTYCLGRVAEVSAKLTTRRSTATITETGEEIEATAPDQVVIAAVLEGGAPIAIHYRGGTSRGTNLLWEINGTDGDLQVRGTNGHVGMANLQLLGGRLGEEVLHELPVPPSYRWIENAPHGIVANVAQTYASYARDIVDETRYCPTFEDAVAHHRFIAAVEEASLTGSSAVP